MRQLLKALKYRFSGDRKALNSYPEIIVNEKFSMSIDNINYQYEISANFIFYGSCRKEDIGGVFDNAYKSLKLNIYGDIQKRMLEMERALFDEHCPSDSLRGMINDIKTEIF